MSRAWNLYNVVDDDGGLWVIAQSFADAIERWRSHIRESFDDPTEADTAEPNSVTLIATDSELVLPAELVALVSPEAST